MRFITPESFRFIAYEFNWFRLGSQLARNLNRPLEIDEVQEGYIHPSFCGLQSVGTLAKHEQGQFRDCVSYLDVSAPGTSRLKFGITTLPRVPVIFERTSSRKLDGEKLHAWHWPSGVWQTPALWPIIHGMEFRRPPNFDAIICGSSTFHRCHQKRNCRQTRSWGCDNHSMSIRRNSGLWTAWRKTKRKVIQFLSHRRWTPTNSKVQKLSVGTRND